MTLSLTDKGFDYVAYYNGAYEDANSLQSLAGTGANSVELSLEYGIDPQTNTVYADPSYTDSLAALGTEIRQATGLGLSAMVRPLIDFVNPADMTGTPYSVDDWRSYYNPGPAGSAGANAFFASYQTMILQEAQVAAANGATSLSIGTELDQITGPAYQGYWDSIVTALRTDDPGLKLTYSADWDDDLSPWQWGGTGLAAGTGNLATQVSFAGELDSIGIDEYAPISDAADPTLAQLIAGWTQTPTDPTTSAVTGKQSLISYFESVAAQIGKPLLFTELGYENASDAAEQPAYTSTGVVDSNLQAQLYQAFFEAWSQAGNSSLTGAYFWNWDPNAAEVGPGNGVNFSPQGLPAQSVATDWFIPAAAPSGLTLSPASDSGVKGDDITNVVTPTIIGGGAAGDSVTLVDGTTLVGTGTVGSAGTWSITTRALAVGAQSLTATQSNASGDVSAASASLTITIDTALPITTPRSVTVAGNSGATAIGIVAPTDSNFAASALTVTIAGLPKDGAVLLPDGITGVTQGEVLSVAQFVGLKFEPTADEFGASATFGYTVTDPAGNIAPGMATLAIQGAVAPSVANPTANQTWAEGQALSLVLPSNTFTDPQGEPLTYGATLSDGSALPSWLTFNAGSETFSGTVPATPQTLTFTVTATDTSNLSAAETFTATIPAVAPSVANPTANQTWTEGQALSLQLSANTFADPQGEALTYSATLSSGSALPSWLTFNAGTETFSGTVPATPQTLTFKVTAADTSNLSAAETFTATIPAVAPAVANPTPNQSWAEGLPLSFALAPNTFTDPQGEALAYGATLSDGSALPSWLTFNAGTETFSGTVPATPQTLTLKVTVTDTSNLSAAETFTATIPAAAPAVANPTANQSWAEGLPLSFALAPNTFTDPQGEALAYGATLSDGSALPSWLSFNAGSETFSGTASATPETLTLKVTAADTSNLSAAETFTATIPAAAPAVANPTPNQIWAEGQALSLVLPANTFTDPQGEALAYGATLSDGSALPSWLSFNAGSETFSGTASATPETLTLKVTAADTSNLSAAETFTATIPAAAPAVANPTANQSWAEGLPLSFALAPNTFTDPQGEALAYGATLSDGSALPSWLTFNAGTETFSGTVPATPETLTLKVTAADTSNLSAAETFTATIPAVAAPRLPADFYGNGVSDVLWHNGGGLVDIWPMGAAGKGADDIVGSTGSPWEIVGTGDFNGTGTDDILWYNTASGAADVWTMQDGQHVADTIIGSAPSVWQIAGIGDFSGNGTDDIAWQNTASGAVDLWTMQNGQHTSDTVITALPSANAKIIATGDFAGTGTDDVLWQDTVTAAVDLWTIQNGAVAATTMIGGAANPWQLAGIGDFNGNGTDDILWYNTSAGLIDVWQMQNGQHIADNIIGTVVPSSQWQIAGVGNYFGNGTDDILWRNAASGAVDIWTMQNGAHTADTVIGSAPPSSWQV